MMSENVVILLQICVILGVEFDENILKSIEDECEQIKYLLNQIYYFLGGE